MNPIPEYTLKYILPYEGRMLELGRKKTKIDGGWVTYKSWFEPQGIDHTSIDIQGGYGSLPLDLTLPIDLPQFDIITNIGTTEHVMSQEPCWRNIHNLLKVGGVLVSITPLVGDWWWHGNWYPYLSFFENLEGYEIEKHGIEREKPNRNLAVRLRKVEDKPFVMPPKETLYYNRTRPRGF